MIGFIIGGAIALIAGIGMILYKKKVANKILAIKYHDNADINTLLNSCISISNELGKGHYSKIVKLDVTATLDQPLIGEFSKASCVYFEAQVEHTYDKLEETKNSEGKITKKWTSKTEVLGSVKKGNEFWITDSNAKITLNIEGANLGLKNEVYNTKKSVKPIEYSFTKYVPINSFTMRSTGVIESEKHIKIGQKLLIIGELHDRDGVPKITKPQNSKEVFVVSTKNEEELLIGLENKSKALLYGGIALSIIGVAIIITGFFQ